MLIRTEALDASVDRLAAAKALEAAVKDVIGVSARVEVGEPGAVERSQGKARRVVDLRSE